MNSEELTQELNKRNITLETIAEYIKFEDECVEKGFTFRSLINAREKQVAKKVTHEATIQKCHTCPNCKNVLDRFDKTLYCWFCGQRLDWSEVN